MKTYLAYEPSGSECWSVLRGISKDLVETIIKTIRKAIVDSVPDG